MNDFEFYAFDLQGYLVVENALSQEQVARWNSLLDEYLAQNVEAETSAMRSISPHLFGEAYTELIDNPRMVPYLTTTCGERFRLDHDYILVHQAGVGTIGRNLHCGGTPYDPSEYYVYRNGKMYNGLTVVAYNLKDVNPGDGGFGCVPASHKSNRPLPTEVCDAEGAHPLVREVAAKAGSAVIFTEALTHGSFPWQGHGERRTLFFKYCPIHMAWGHSYEKRDNTTGLTESQQKIMRTPGVSYKD